MKIFLVTDLEGVACVMNSTDWIYPNSKYYELGKELLTKEVNAAVDGFFAAGATEVVVCDGHGAGAINGMLLDSRAKLQRGADGGYPFHADRGYDAIAWVGQHPKAGTEYGHLCHTQGFDYIDYSINGISIGEFGQTMFSAQTFGVVPIFGSGCLAFTKEAEALVPGIETVAVKEGLVAGSGDECSTEVYERRNWPAIHMSPEESRKAIRAGAERALRRFIEHPETFHPTKISPPFSSRKVIRVGGSAYVKELSGYEDVSDLLNHQ